MGTIKQLGTNGGGFFNVDLAHPFENPTALTNFVFIWLTALHPVRAHLHLRQDGGQHPPRRRPAAAMVIIFGVWVGFTSYAEHQNNPAVVAAGVPFHGRQHRGQGGALRRHHQCPVQRVDDADLRRCRRQRHRLLQPDGRLRPAHRHDARRGHPGGTGSGLYTILIYAIIAVFIGGLMIGRTPEYLGKKIQAKEVKLAGLGALVMPIIVLVLTAIAVSIHAGRAGPLNARAARLHRDPLRASPRRPTTTARPWPASPATPPSTTSSAPSTC